MTTAMELSNQTALVTGASRGIGRAITLELARAGADIVLHARQSRAALESVAGEVRALGRKAETALFDLSDPANHETLVAQMWRDDRPIDIWVNSAGADVLTAGAAKWPFERKLEALWKVDVTATIRLSRLVGAKMKDRGKGAILNIGWDQAQHGMAGDSGELFAAVKGAVMAFSKGLAATLAPQVRVNCLAPGWIKTAWGQAASQEWQRRAARESLLERWGTPEDVARVARFLVSPQAGFITGQVIAVNGGFRYGP